MRKIICRVIQHEAGNSVFQNTANGCLLWEQHRLLKNSVLLSRLELNCTVKVFLFADFSVFSNSLNSVTFLFMMLF